MKLEFVAANPQNVALKLKTFALKIKKHIIESKDF